MEEAHPPPQPQQQQQQPQPEESQLQLEGVVIITLPPVNNPSKGKTITAIFTQSTTTITTTTTTTDVSSPHPYPTTNITPDHDADADAHQLPPPNGNSSKLKRVMGILSVTLCVFFLWQMVSPQVKTIMEYEWEEEREDHSYLYTLYRKPADGTTILRLGTVLSRQVRWNGTGVSLHEDIKIGSTSNTGAGTGGGKGEPAPLNSSTVLPVKGNVYPDGLYYVSLLVGDPPRPYYLDVDTGSDLTWIQCDAPCTSCSQGPHPLYKPTKNKIVPPRDSLCAQLQTDQSQANCGTCSQCDYRISYADHGSSMGVLVKDSLQLMIANGTGARTPFIFGCAYDQRGPLLSSPAKTDGILGLGNAKISIVSQLTRQGIIRNVVGHCISADVSIGGYLFFGDDFVPFAGLNWVPMLNDPSLKYHHSDVMKITVGSNVIASANKLGPVVFDSGSSFTYFTNDCYRSLVATLKDAIGNKLVLDESDTSLPVCWRGRSPVRSVQEVQSYFKPLILYLSSQLSRAYEIPPEGYLVVTKKGNVCLGILDGRQIHDGRIFILGDISLRGQLVVYDNQRQTIGWAKSNCVKPQKLKSFPFF